ncbi:hypothetical protein HGB13_00250 [bacterium]|nr:hypothetical protein [bacterium]
MQPIPYKLGNEQAKKLKELREISPEKFELSIQIQSDFLYFAKAFFELTTRQPFVISNPVGSVSHVIQIVDAFKEVYRMKCSELYIQVPPRSGKSYLSTSFIAYTMSLNPYANFIYTGYTEKLALQMSGYIRDIMTSEQYQKHFGVYLRDDSQSKHLLKVEDGGEIIAAGAGGTITGRGAGMSTERNVFGGAIFIDDPHGIERKWIPKEESDKTLEWFEAKVRDRVNSPWTPIIIIGHRVGEYDLQGRLLKKRDPGDYKLVKIPAIYTYEGKEYSYDPMRRPLETQIIDGRKEKGLLEIRAEDPEWFETLYQQNPMAVGKQLFKPSDFEIKSADPEILFTFIAADTAETSKTYNDATVFSFFGVYKLATVADTYALHWIDCEQLWVEPKDLKGAFMRFYDGCCRHKIKPSFAIIEEKSTGVTLVSELKSYQGIEIIAVKRTTDKISRFQSIQPYIARRLVSFTNHAKHLNMCIDHMAKITPTGAHRFDDIADTLYDGVKIGLMDTIYRQRFIGYNSGETDAVVKDLAADFMNIQRLKALRY